MGLSPEALPVHAGIFPE